ncbi:MAG: Serine 3-dehydrogenase [Chlamydiae bacterium]|nr:Serine 3-dehydrogenase [Chlamydiota bacterium]
MSGLALITGATSGIGEALARLLASKGFSLILTGRNQEKLEKLAKELTVQKIIVADLSKREGQERVLEEIRRSCPDLLINNAGFGLYGTAHTLPIEKQRDMVEVNSLFPLQSTLVCAQTLIEAKKKGTILNVSSVGGEYPTPGMSVYGATKAFLTSLSQGLYTELASKGVSVLASCPGMVSTDFATRAAGSPVEKVDGPVMSEEYAARQIWRQIEKKKEKKIFSSYYQIGSFLATHFLPVSFVKNLIWKKVKDRL